MLAFLRREALYLVGGFIVVFIIYLYITFDPSKVTQGLLIGLAGGVATAILIFLLDKVFPGRRADRKPPSPE